ncbi:MAG TPA: SpoIID/LytB domain-containing protein [Acidimicrobiia bacterium]|nr:SpoIID/LytB domain-containing protein [Acidimicrobiia bacterium]
MKLRVLFLSAILLLPALPVTAASDEPWVFEGGGWGHGVGMSQFGALGQAEEGRSVEKILSHYYTDASIGSVLDTHWANNPEGIRVGIASNTTSVNLAAVGGSVTVCLPADDCATQQEINPGEDWRYEVNAENSSECRLNWVANDPSTPWDTCSASISDIGTNNRISVDGRQLGRGTVLFEPSSAGFHVVVALPLEEYLYGLAEVPFSWHPTALQVQAISGRSFAVATAKERANDSGKVNSTWSTICGCHLRATVFDQVYLGYDNELKSQANLWRDAVNATAGKVVTYDSKTIKTFYSSSNGGASENNEDVWGGSPLPYLRSVPDQWSADPNINPLARWSVKVEEADLADELGWDRALDARLLQGPPGVQVEFTGVKDGQLVTTTRNGTQLRALLGQIGFGYEPVLGGNTSIRVSPYITAVLAPPAFIDIIGNTFEKDIEWLAFEGITKGCNPPDNTLFCPHDSVTRGQMAAFIKRFLNLPPATKDHFVDDNGNTFENDINRLAEAGITKGCNPPADDRFCPDDLVSREQMAAFLVRALELTANTHQGFDDVSSSNTFYNDIAKLATAGITEGCNPPANTSFCPGDFVTRGQMAAFLHRAADFR